MSNGAILATRRGGDVLIADEPVRIELAWPSLRSADDEEISLRWTMSIACVDSPADRALLAERFLLGGGSVATLAVGRAAIELSRAVAPTMIRIVSALKAVDVEAMDAKSIESAIRAAAFAVGLAVLPPFELIVTRPARERDRRLVETRERLADIAISDEARAKSIAEMANAIAETAGDAARAQRTLAGLRLADPLDVLRATAIAQPAWSSPSPALWIAAGTQLLKVDVTAATLDMRDVRSVGDALGPIRSVSAARIDGIDVLLVGVRDGVHVMTNDEQPRITRSFTHVAESEFGFNAACFLNGERLIVATHSKAGIVAWRFDDVVEPHVTSVEGARSIIANGDDVAMLIVKGGLATYSREAGVDAFAGNLRLMSVSIEGRDGVRVRKLIREDSISTSDARFGRPIGVEDEIEVGGVPRAIRPLVAGGLIMMDAAGLTSLPIGPPSLVARSVAARPGFAALVSVDRARVAVIDLSQPEKVAVDLHIVAKTGSRVADIEFA